MSKRNIEIYILGIKDYIMYPNAFYFCSSFHFAVVHAIALKHGQ